MKFFDYIKPKGHLQISKLYKNGNEEVIFDEDNVIVSGFGVGLSYLFTLSGSQKITDFQIDRFQLGVCSTQTATSSVYKLDYPISSVADYGTNSKLLAVSATQIQNGTNVANQVFVLIPFKNVTRINNNTVRYTLTLDENALNNLTNYPGGNDASLREIGLYLKNIRNDSPTASILAAYRQFSAIRKTSDFSLVFKWSIQL